jgi:cob(I)alamin adenosyltransferase
MSGKWDLVVLDEINYAITCGMLDPAKSGGDSQRENLQVHVI